MCRLLAVRSAVPFAIEKHLGQLARLSHDSPIFQGHGWGCSYLKEGQWEHYKNIRPIWEDDLSQFGTSTLLVAHARSAFRDEGIVVDNNMPFHDRKRVFVFNGELRGVRIKAEGRIGAEKVFNFIKRLDQGNLQEGLERALRIIRRRTRDLKACNLIIANARKLYVASIFSERPEYFTMYHKKGPLFIVCSEAYPGETWEPIANNTVTVY
jgi:glutamine amidotransferase